MAPVVIRDQVLGVEDTVLLHVIAVDIMIFDNRQCCAELAHMLFDKRKLAECLPLIYERWRFEAEEFLKRFVSQPPIIELLVEFVHERAVGPKLTLWY